MLNQGVAAPQPQDHFPARLSGYQAEGQPNVVARPFRSDVIHSMQMHHLQFLQAAQRWHEETGCQLLCASVDGHVCIHSMVASSALKEPALVGTSLFLEHVEW